MRGYRFYLEHATPADKRARRDMGTVFALAYESRPTPSGHREGAGGVYDYRNAPVCWTTIDPGYLRSNCRRISEAEARRVHPRLFAYLERTP